MAGERPFKTPTMVLVSGDEHERSRVVRFPRQAYGTEARFPLLVAIRTTENDDESPLIAAGGAWGGPDHSPEGTGVLVSPELFAEIDAAGAQPHNDARIVYVRSARPFEVLRHARHLRVPVIGAGLLALAATAGLLDQEASSTAPLVIALAALVLGTLAALAAGAATVALAIRQ